MRIKSDFKDYYDYVEFLYSPQGGDRSETYLRRKIKGNPDPSNIFHDGSIRLDVEGFIQKYPTPLPSDRGMRYIATPEFPWSFKWCAFCGKLYLLVAEVVSNPNSINNGFTEVLEYRVISNDHPVLDEVTSFRWTWKRERPPFDTVFAVPNQACLKASKLLNQPVFLIDNFTGNRTLYDDPSSGISRIVVDSKVPNLGKLGFPAAIPPEQAYQEISMFLGSLKDNPDQNPPVNVSDKDRLVQKGFDSKVSFRGKAPKPSNN